jgi:2-oxoisovalerate dehydrogenase E1 component
MPSNAYDAKGLFTNALQCYDPVLFLEHKSLIFTKGAVPEEEYTIPFGEARIAKEGDAATIATIGSMVPKSLSAAEKLAQEGINVEVIDLRTVAPLDTNTVLESVHKTGRLLIVDETFQPFGIGAEVAAQVTEKGFDDLDAPIMRLNGIHTPTPYSPPLETAIVPNKDTIEQALRDLLAE